LQKNGKMKYFVLVLRLWCLLLCCCCCCVAEDDAVAAAAEAVDDMVIVNNPGLCFCAWKMLPVE